MVLHHEDFTVPSEVRCEACGAVALAENGRPGGEVASMLERDPGRLADWAILEARNQELFRITNERLAFAALVAGHGDEQLSFFCECGDGRCWVRADLTLVEYETVREYPTRFLIAHDHDDAGLESPRRLQLAVTDAGGAHDTGGST